MRVKSKTCRERQGITAVDRYMKANMANLNNYNELAYDDRTIAELRWHDYLTKWLRELPTTP